MAGLRALAWLIFAVFVVGVGAIGCSDDSNSGGDEGESTETALPDTEGGADTADSGPTEECAERELNAEGFCLTSADCAGGWCDKRKKGCVQCYLDGHCPDGQGCFDGLCEEAPECTGDGDCGDGVCSDGICAQCTDDEQCGNCWACIESVCRPEAPPCTDESDCNGFGANCDFASNTCLDCNDQSACSEAEFCDVEAGKICTPDSCVPSNTECSLDGKAVKICRDDGKGSYLETCEEGLVCLGAGNCVEPQCDNPGTTTCLQEQQLICTPDGTPIVAKCPPSGTEPTECKDGDCVPLPQRVLVIFDTSGSMNADPTIQAYPNQCAAGNGEEDNCIEPWPACDPGGDPFTVLGVSKKVFSNFFNAEGAENVAFALQRFPQRIQRAAPVCEGGYAEGDVAITGDNGTHAPPLGVTTYFEQAMDEVILEPFPPPNSSSNLLALNQWLDFNETLFQTDTPCLTSDDCDNGVCLGPTGNKTCQLYTNPELRAHGWTPLGRSLFYAGEYFRRFVVIDGKPCSSDADCNSPGYFCQEATGTCADPNKDCRVNLIVLFTDGGETQNPFTTDFFNPQIQAKRLRYGLGCEQDTDCSDLQFCRKPLTNKECTTDGDCTSLQSCSQFGLCQQEKDAGGDDVDIECFTNYCKADATGNYCSNDVLEGVSSGLPFSPPQYPAGATILPGGASPVLKYRDIGFGADRLRDYNGNPIELVVNVVDASQVDPESVANNALSANAQIAYQGGGLHVVVSVTQEADFLANLLELVDFKSLVTKCLVNGNPE